MDTRTDDPLGFAPDYDAPVEYMRRTREYYLTLGFDNPYRWAHYIDVPFQRLARPLSQSRVTIVTTAAPYQPDKGPQGKGAPYNAGAKFYKVYSGETDRDHDLRISHVGVDRDHCDMEETNAWFPLPALRRAEQRGRIGAVAARFHGAPTNRSQRHTIDVDAPEILARCREDGVDAAVLVPNCPVCHQTIGLVARHLEANGIPTVIIGAAKDIVEHCGVPRFVFSDFPLGNAAGRPHDVESQAFTLELALQLLELAPAPRTTVQSPLRWAQGVEWKRDYLALDRMPPEEVARRRREVDEAKRIAAGIRSTSAAGAAG